MIKNAQEVVDRKATTQADNSYIEVTFRAGGERSMAFTSGNIKITLIFGIERLLEEIKDRMGKAAGKDPAQDENQKVGEGGMNGGMTMGGKLDPKRENFLCDGFRAGSFAFHSTDTPPGYPWGGPNAYVTVAEVVGHGPFLRNRVSLKIRVDK